MTRTRLAPTNNSEDYVCSLVTDVSPRPSVGCGRSTDAHDQGGSPEGEHSSTHGDNRTDDQTPRLALTLVSVLKVPLGVKTLVVTGHLDIS